MYVCISIISCVRAYGAECFSKTTFGEIDLGILIYYLLSDVVVNVKSDIEMNGQLVLFSNFPGGKNGKPLAIIFCNNLVVNIECFIIYNAMLCVCSCRHHHDVA